MRNGIIFDASDVHSGFTDEELENLCKLNSRFDSGYATWASVESESSSFGKTIREWGFFPKLLPLYVCSDHGVHWESKCWPNETKSSYQTYFTWNKKKNNLMNQVQGKRSYHVPHPWVYYRKKYFSEISRSGRGTLVFFPHSNDTTTPVFQDLDGYIHAIKSLPERYHPIVICLSYSDIEKGLHKKLRKYNLPLVTAGTMVSQCFVDRFYSILLRFRYSTSANIGSHTFYSIEAGIPFFLFGAYPEYYVEGSDAVPDGRINLRDYGDDEDIEGLFRLKLLLSSDADDDLENKYAIVAKYLGLDTDTTRTKFSLILWKEFFLHFDQFLVTYFARFFRLVLRAKTFFQ